MYNEVVPTAEETIVNLFNMRMSIVSVSMFSFFDWAFGAPPLGTRLRCLVFAHVNFIQVRAVEGHATIRTNVGFLTSVGLLVGY